MFGPPRHIVLNADFVHLAADDVEKMVNVFQAFGALVFQQLGDAFVFFGVLMAKAQVFQLPFELPHAQAVGKWGENIQRFFGNGAFFGAVGRLPQKLHGARAQRQLNQHHANIGHHRQQHFAHGFGLRGAFIGRGKRVHFGKMGELLHFVYALHQRYHGFAALLGHGFLPIGQIAGNLG